jgi:hypothetical protein
MSKIPVKIKIKKKEPLPAAPKKYIRPLSDKERETEMMKELNKKGAMPPSQKNVG